MPGDAWPDFVETFTAHADAVLSPTLLKRWTAIALLAGALERRVWARTGPGVVYPNLYVMLVAPVGKGKGIIKFAKDLLGGVNEPGKKNMAFHIASTSITCATLVDELGAAKCSRFTKSGPILTYNSLWLIANELQVLMPKYDPALVGKWNDLWDNLEYYSESRRTGSVKDIRIDRPTVNILTGVQPAYFASTFDEDVWSTGLARRFIMIYNTDVPWRSLWYEGKSSPESEAQVRAALAKLSQMQGQMTWTAEAADRIDAWQQAGRQGEGGPPIPEHPKLVTGYNASRTLQVIKLAILAAVSRSGKFEIGLQDVDRAIAWLLEAEIFMPDIFRSITGKSDATVIEETHLFIERTYSQMVLKSKANGGGVVGVNESRIRQFLLSRVPSEKVRTVFDEMVKSELIARLAGTMDLWVPQVKRME